ncbi:toll/interleukin-1 receptor domain-containing protein [Streptomyces sp. NPDC088253]|uniref:toll/interleukin-1 receptor domain-containing protein n=1 Tax=Streptomyces sp. NPDC088253 TaxID=3365846 RepID=UPI00382C2ABC
MPERNRDAVLPLVEALRGAGVSVFLDESGIDEFDGITQKIRSALAGARLFVAYYSGAYPKRPACQWELLTAFRAAVRWAGQVSVSWSSTQSPDRTTFSPCSCATPATAWPPGPVPWQDS